METLNTQLRAAQCYVPKRLRVTYARMHGLYGDAKALTRADGGTAQRRAIVVLYKGNIPRRSFAGYIVVVCDIGKVGAKFGDVAIQNVVEGDPKIPMGNPFRVGVNSKRFYLL